MTPLCIDFEQEELAFYMTKSSGQTAELSKPDRLTP